MWNHRLPKSVSIQLWSAHERKLKLPRIQRNRHYGQVSGERNAGDGELPGRHVTPVERRSVHVLLIRQVSFSNDYSISKTNYFVLAATRRTNRTFNSPCPVEAQPICRRSRSTPSITKTLSTSTRLRPLRSLRRRVPRSNLAPLRMILEDQLGLRLRVHFSYC